MPIVATLVPPPPLPRLDGIVLPDDPPTISWEVEELERLQSPHADAGASEEVRAKLPNAIANASVPINWLKWLSSEDLVAFWRATPRTAWVCNDGMLVDQLLYAVGLEALPVLLALGRRPPWPSWHGLERVVSPGVALYAATQDHLWMGFGWGEWLVKHRARAAGWLARYALGGDDDERTAARRGLAFLVRVTDGEAERAALAGLGATPEHIDRVLWPFAEDWKQSPIEPVRPSRLWNPLPPVPLRDGTVASPDDVQVLLGVLKKCVPFEHPILARVRERVTVEALDALLESAWQEWRTTQPDTTAWLVEARLRRRGAPGAVELLADAQDWVRSPTFKIGKAGERAVELLGQYGGREVLPGLAALAAKPPNEYVKPVAQAAFEALKLRLGDTAEDELDRIVPAFGLDGPLVFDFGPRQFQVRLGPDAAWDVRGTDGTVKDDLPAPRKKDDAALANAAVARWKAFKKEAKATLAVQRARLEQALVTERRYPAEHFRTYIAGNPAFRLLTAGLVWSQGDRTFRIAEDGTFANETDDGYALGTEPVRLAHPIHLDADLRGRWSTVILDYGFLPVIRQIDREVHADPPPDGWIAPAGAVRGLTRFGWVEDGGGWIEGASRTVNGTRAAVSFDPGILRFGMNPDERIAVSTPEWGGVPATPVIRSEILRDLYRVHRPG